MPLFSMKRWVLLGSVQFISLEFSVASQPSPELLNKQGSFENNPRTGEWRWVDRRWQYQWSSWDESGFAWSWSSRGGKGSAASASGEMHEEAYRSGMSMNDAARWAQELDDQCAAEAAAAAAAMREMTPKAAPASKPAAPHDR